MAISPYRIIDKRSSYGWTNDRLFDAAIQTNKRKIIPNLDYDTHQNVSSLGRRTLLTLGRTLEANFPIVTGAIDEIANFAAQIFIAQFVGKDSAWGDAAELWLWSHDKICDVRGWPYNALLYRVNLIRAILRDGDAGTILTQTQNGYPQLQVIPGHRIGSRSYSSDGPVSDGPYAGRRLIDGVIVNDYGAPLAYRVFGENQWDSANYQDISTNDMFLSFRPRFADQVRGFSLLASCLFNLQDTDEFRKWQLIALKAAASIAIVEKNDIGGPMPGASMLTGPTSGSAVAGTPTGLYTESYDGGIVRYIRPNGEVMFPTSNRPSQNESEFETKIIAAALYSLGWSVDFALGAKSLGGAPMRICVEKINRTLDNLRDTILLPACRRFDGFRISKACKEPLNILKPNVDWFRWEYQAAARFTADAKYDSDVDLQEWRAGMRTLSEICARDGNYWEEVQDQKIAEEKRLQDKCKAAGVDPNNVRLLTPNGNPTTQPGADNQQPPPTP